MCRRRELYGFCMLSSGLGLILGCWIHSWFWCILGGALLIGGGISMLNRRM